jgi:hypothetical protein
VFRAKISKALTKKRTEMSEAKSRTSSAAGKRNSIVGGSTGFNNPSGSGSSGSGSGSGSGGFVQRSTHNGTELDVASLNLAHAQQLGRGAFGVVYKAEWRGDAVAVKVVSGVQLSESQIADFQKELDLVLTIRHTCVVQTLAASTVPPNMVLVMELMEGGSLSDRIHKAVTPLTPAERVAIAIQITRGLQYLHGTGASTTERVIVHSDLKPENVMLTKRGGTPTPNAD